MTSLANFFARIREQSNVWLSRAIIILLLGLIFFVAFGGVSQKNAWQIIEVRVEGATAVPEDSIRSLVLEKILGNYFLVYAKNNSYLFPAGDIVQSLLSAFPRIESASTRRNDDHSISVIIVERKPYALWCGVPSRGSTLFQSAFSVHDECWFIDNSGFVFDHAPVFSSGVYLEVYSDLLEKNSGDPLRGIIPFDRFSTANTFVKLLREKVGEPLRVSLKKEGEDEIVIKNSATYPFLSGVSIKFNDEELPADLIKNLTAAIPVQFPNGVALKKKLLYIDMRFGNKIFFGFEN